MRRSFLLALCFGLSTLVSAPWAFANGNFFSVSGDVKAATGTAAPASVMKDQRIVPGTTVTTGPGAQTIMRFDDGHTVVLNENSEFRISQYSFDKDKPQSDSIGMQILKGALRSVSGLIGSRNRNAFALLAPQATIGIRGTDFMIALVNPAYLSVIQGSIATTNAAGTAVFGAGTTATVTTSAALGAAIPASALPSSVAASFSSLSSAAVSAGVSAASSTTGAGTGAGAGAGGAGGAGAAGAGAAVGAGVGGITAGMIAAGALVAGAVVAATQSTEEQTTTPTTTTTATSTAP